MGRSHFPFAIRLSLSVPQGSLITGARARALAATPAQAAAAVAIQKTARIYQTDAAACSILPRQMLLCTDCYLRAFSRGSMIHGRPAALRSAQLRRTHYVLAFALAIIFCHVLRPCVAAPFPFSRRYQVARNLTSPIRDIQLGELTVSPSEPNLTISSLLVRPGASLFFSLKPTAEDSHPAAYLIEVLHDPLLSREERPDPLLLAQQNEQPNPFRVLSRFSVSDSSADLSSAQPESSFRDARGNSANSMSAKYSKQALAPDIQQGVSVLSSTRDMSLGDSSNFRRHSRADSISFDDGTNDSVWMEGRIDTRDQTDDLPTLVRHFASTRARAQTRVKYRSDAEAFVTWRPYSYLVLRMVRPEDLWHIRVLNHNGTVMNVLNATVKISMETPPTHWRGSAVQQLSSWPQLGRGHMSGKSSYRPGRGHSLCPRGQPWPYVGTWPKLAQDCSGHGYCRLGKCICDHSFQGRYCESLVKELPRDSFSVPVEQMVYYYYKVPVDGAVAAVLRFSPSPSDTANSPVASHPILFAKRLGENGGHLLPEGPPLPSTYDTMFSDRVSFRARLSSQIVVRRYLTRGDTLYFGIFNYRRSPLEWMLSSRSFRKRPEHLFHKPARVRLEVYPCEPRQHDSLLSIGGNHNQPLLRFSVKNLSVNFHKSRTSELTSESRSAIGIVVAPTRARPFCPVPPMPIQMELGIAYMMLPLVLGMCSLLTAFICVTAWARILRHHLRRLINGNTVADDLADVDVHWASARDQLSSSEICAMFPSFVFSKAQGAALSAAGDPSCSVCLSSYEPRDCLRRLRCGHSYHAACLDPWLRRNATCPRCRTSARIADPSSRSLIWLPRMLQGVSRHISIIRQRFNVP